MSLYNPILCVCVGSRWSCDDTVTHYIYQGRVGDNTREYRAVKERGVHVVSQHWLQAVRKVSITHNKHKCTA